MTLQLVQLRVDPRAVMQSAQVGQEDPGYHLHAWLSGVFGPGVLQPFCVMEGNPAVWMGYSQLDAQALRELAEQFATPSAMRGLLEVESKPMPAQWPVGHRVGFVVRAVPSVRIGAAIKAAESGYPSKNISKGSELDVYEAAMYRGRETTREQEYQEWLSGQLERHGGVELESFTLRAYRSLGLLRRAQGGRRSAKRIRLPEAWMEGVMRVGDAERFGALLERGVGRHRAFGFGMLMLRPPPR